MTFDIPNDQRQIKITIDSNFVCFTFLTSDQHFYDFYREDWDSIKGHMKEKSWFTDKMFNYLNQHL